MDTVLHDVRYGFRMMLKSPAFTAVAVIAIALGIGANTAMFSVIDAVLLRPLPFPDPGRLVMVLLAQKGDTGKLGHGDADFLAIRERQRSFEHVAAFSVSSNAFALTGMGNPEQLRGVWVTSDFFRTLDVAPKMGRTFRTDEDRKGSQPVVVISENFWRSHLDSAADAIGRAITLNGTPYTIVGVMPANFRFPENQSIDVWPLKTFGTPRARPPYYLFVFGRLKHGIDARQAAADLSSISAQLTQQYPNSNFEESRTQPMKEFVVSRVQTALLVLVAAVGFVLLIAIVNVANLLLARSTARLKEMAIRRALGASRWRLVRQVLTESVMLAALGGIAGFLLADWAVQAFLSFEPGGIPRLHEVTINGRILLFTCAASLGAGLLFGVAPALQGPRLVLHDSLKEGGRTSAEGAGQRTRRALVISEFALALVLMIGAGLLIRSFLRLQQVNPGIRSDHLLTLRLNLPAANYRDPVKIAGFWDQLTQKVQALAGVESASVALSIPPNLGQLTNPFTVEGQPYDKTRPLQLADELSISPDYFRTLGVPLLRGRFFTDADKKTKGLILINETMAKRYFPGQDPVGKRLQTGDPDPTSPWATIIGVVGDVKYSGLDAQSMPQLYVLYTEGDWIYFSRSMYLIVRTSPEPLGVLPEVREAIGSLDRDIPLSEIATMEQLLDKSVIQERFRTWMLGSFAALALLLAAVGIYAVMSYAVGQRTHEIGVRMALGAKPGDVLAMVLGQATWIAAVGLGIGLVGAFVLTRAMRSLLFDISATDPISFAATSIVLISVALLACYVPARRATRVDPMIALRYE